LGTNPGVDAVIQYVERKGTCVENLVVEVAEVEFVTESFLGAVAEFKDLQLANFVSESLAGPSDVAINFSLDIRLVDVGVIVEILDHLFEGPVLGVDPGIYDQTDGAPDVAFESSVVGVWILIEADIFAQTL
jgi:hypothetical protein